MNTLIIFAAPSGLGFSSADSSASLPITVGAWKRGPVFSNHYHFVGHSPENTEDASNLSTMLNVLHSRTGEWINGLDETPKRQVWFNFRETRLTFQRSYLARLNYVHQNAVHHRLVPVANQYPWCSAAWFERSVSTAVVKSIYRFKLDQVQVYDSFQPEVEW